MTGKRKFPFQVPRNFVTIRISKPKICRVAIEVSPSLKVSFFDLERGIIISLKEVKEMLSQLPSEEQIVLKDFLDKCKTKEDMIKYWARTVLHYHLYKRGRCNFTYQLAQEILEKEQRKERISSNA